MVNVADYTNKNLGKVEIAPEVLSVIAIIATSEVEGISGHFADLKNTNLEKINHKNFNKLLKIDAKKEGINIDVYCSLKHGTKISKAASNIQSAIFNSIKTMTAIELNQINVHITHITVEK